MGMTSADILDRISALRERGEEFCVATVVRTENATSAKAGAKAVVTCDGEIHGFIGGSCVHGAVLRVAKEVLRDGAPRLIRVKPKEDVVEQVDTDGVELHKSSCPSGGTIELFIEAMRTPHRCFVCGASPVAAAFVALAAAMGYRTVVAALAEDHDKIPGAETYLDGFDLSLAAPAPVVADVVIIATQGKRDREAVQAALGTECAYIAMVGSRKKAQALKDGLREMGMADQNIARLKAPAGLDIGAIEPEEIALSIMGEVVQFRRQSMRQSVHASETIIVGRVNAKS